MLQTDNLKTEEGAGREIIRVGRKETFFLKILFSWNA